MQATLRLLQVPVFLFPWFRFSRFLVGGGVVAVGAWA